MTRYQAEPDFEPAQEVRHDVPFTVALTVSFALLESVTLIGLRVEVPVRRFTPLQAGTIAVEVDAGAGAGVGAGVGVGVGVGASAQASGSAWAWAWGWASGPASARSTRWARP